jgi:hypothetical protein
MPALRLLPLTLACAAPGDVGGMGEGVVRLELALVSPRRVMSEATLKRPVSSASSILASGLFKLKIKMKISCL